MNLVAGATGPIGLGFDICGELRGMGKPVRAISRPTSNPDRVASLRAIGVEVVFADVNDSASLDRACQGVTTVITTVTAVGSRQPGADITTVDQLGQMALVDAARSAGVSRFIYTSYSGHIDPGEVSPLTIAKRTVERYIQQSGIGFTILRPTYFTEVWFSPLVGFDYPNAKAQVYGSGRNRTAWVSRPDVARIAALSVDNADVNNAVLEIGGPQRLSPDQVVRIFEEVSGRPFEVQHVPEEALRSQVEMATDPLQKSLVTLMLYYALGDPTDSFAAFGKFPTELGTVSDYARRVLGEKAGSSPLTGGRS